MLQHRFFRLATVIFTLASASAAPACGGASLPTVATPPPDAVRSLTFLLVPASGNGALIANTNDVIQSAFISAEYKITTDPNDAHDGTIVIAASASEVQSFMTVEINGKRRVNYAVHVNVTVKDGSSIVDERTAQFETSGEEAERGVGLGIVNDLTDSMRFRQWAMKANNRRIAATSSATAEPVASATSAPTAAPSASTAQVSAPAPSSAAETSTTANTTPTTTASTAAPASSGPTSAAAAAMHRAKDPNAH
jgi:hypothetical protein